MKVLPKKTFIILSICLIFIIIAYISLPVFLDMDFSFFNQNLFKIKNLTKIYYFFFLILPILIIYLLVKNYFSLEKSYFFEFICHFSTYLLFGFPFLFLSYLTDFLFNHNNKKRTFYNLLISFLSFLLIDYSLYYFKDYGYIFCLLILFINSFYLNYFNNDKYIYSNTITLWFYSIFIISIHFLYFTLALKENYYLPFFIFSFFLLFLINILNVYFNIKSEIEKQKSNFLEDMLNLTFNSDISMDKENYFKQISNLLLKYLNFDLLFIGKLYNNSNDLQVIFAIEKGKILNTQIIKLKNTISSLAIKSKSNYTYFEDISKIPNIMYARLDESKISTKSFLGIPIKDKYKRDIALIGVEKESKEKIKKFQIELLILFSKYVQFVLQSCKD
ncbi:MAG: hypothetical protein GYA61_01135 [Spirochaetales bacterium]|jgi:hypothetical protein|nr:hypothetical protein [Exilispira sp.]NMC66806.1 hypothetical protein [Spirochaetales bacterium]